MTNATMLLQTSQAEGVSRVLREAMYMNLPVASYALSGTRDILDPERHAKLVPPGDTAAMTVAIEELLQDPVSRRRMAQAARERYDHRHARRVYMANVATSFGEIGTREGQA